MTYLLDVASIETDLIYSGIFAKSSLRFFGALFDAS